MLYRRRVVRPTLTSTARRRSTSAHVGEEIVVRHVGNVIET